MDDRGYNYKRVAEEFAIMRDLGLDSEFEAIMQLSLLEFLKLVEVADFRFRYQPGDLKMKGVEARHEILKRHIAKLEEVKTGAP